MFDPQTNLWSRLESMPLNSSGASAAALNGAIYVFGGETKNYPWEQARTFTSNYRYDPETNYWTSEPDMPTPRHGLAAMAFDGMIFVIGGGEAPGGTNYGGTNEIYRPSC
jgi:N-acetylneuraminic acid mutarotase